nr:MAG TPA: hypothetical protein [Caudoviricetes sp.]
MIYQVKTEFTPGTEIYSLNNLGTISSYFISKVLFEGKDDGDSITIEVKYTIVNSKHQIIDTIDIKELKERFFLDKKDIVKHIVEQI